jgi:hypothetical protein
MSALQSTQVRRFVWHASSSETAISIRFLSVFDPNGQYVVAIRALIRPYLRALAGFRRNLHECHRLTAPWTGAA